MKHNPLHKWELLALWSLGTLIILGTIYTTQLGVGAAVEHSQTIGIVIGGLLAALPMIINAMRNIGQAQAMQSMAEQLGNSSPATAADKANEIDDTLDLTGAQVQ